MLYPVEVWQNIAQSLTVADLLRLCAVSKEMAHVVQATELWRPLVLGRWFVTEDADRSVLQSVEDYIQYYKRRHLQDAHARSVICSPGFTLDKAWELASIGDELIPLLSTMRNDYHDLHARYIAVSILVSIRRVQAIRSLNGLLHATGPVLFEEVFEKVSRLDRAYDLLAPHRTRVLRNTIQNVKSDPRLRDCRTVTAHVLLIIEALSHQIHRVVGWGFSQESLDNLSILRHYAGECGACPIQKNSIIQKICHEFGIDSAISSTFLVVKDPSYPEGYSYISIRSGSFNASVYTIDEVYSTIQRTLPNRRGTVESVIKPWELMDLMRSLIQYQQTDSIVRDAMMRESMADYATTYPISKIHIKAGICDYFTTCCLFMTNQNLSVTMLKKLAQLFPIDAAFLQDALFKEHPLDIKTIARENFMTITIPQIDGITLCTESKYQLGQIVRHSSGALSVIVGVYNVKNEFSEDIQMFYHLLNGLNVNETRITPVDNMDGNQLQDMLNHHCLGVYFKRFDDVEGRFLPNEKLQKAYDASTCT